MNNQERLKQIHSMAHNDKEAITMILSACADKATENGALLSVGKFDEAAGLILEYLHMTACVRTISSQLMRAADELIKIKEKNNVLG